MHTKAIPDFIVIGAPKCGTTTLWNILSQHHEISACIKKEPNFFNQDQIFERGLEYYSSLFPNRNIALAGEATTQYSQTRQYPKTLNRIIKQNPNVKLIFMMRHPIKVLESRWRQLLSNRDPVSVNFNEAVRNYPPLLENALHGQTIKDVESFFPIQQLHIIVFEDFIHDPEKILNKLCAFLGISPLYSRDFALARDNASEEKVADSAIVRTLRRSSIGLSFRDVLPMPVRALMRPLVTRPLPRARWSDAVYNDIVSLIRDDAKLSLKYAGKEENFWEF